MSDKINSYPKHLYGSVCSGFDSITNNLSELLFKDGNDKFISDFFKDILDFKGVDSVYLNFSVTVHMTNGGDMVLSQDFCQGGII